MLLGLDLGAAACKAVVADAACAVVARANAPVTSGLACALARVLDEGLTILRERYGARLEVLGLGTTGSGRHLAAKLLGADLAKNEITAQLAGAVRHFPDVETILEIGGQDSKYMSVASGGIADLTMNKVCAAGTGSFLEEQCERLGLDVKRDFARIAAEATSPADLGARCTVFMETELVARRREGVPLPDLLDGLADSVARNYLERVVGSHPIGRRVVFQGGVASDRAVVKAFERILGRPVLVHPLNGPSGAIGAALLTHDAMGTARTRFRGLGPIGAHDARTFECRACENLWQVTQVAVGGMQVYFGGICDRFSARDPDRASRTAGPPDLFAERQVLLQACLRRATATDRVGRSVGIRHGCR